jgi:hypothetical protein
MVAQKQNTPHIPYVRHPIGLGIVDTITSTLATSPARHFVGSRIMVMIALGPVTPAAQ